MLHDIRDITLSRNDSVVLVSYENKVCYAPSLRMPSPDEENLGTSPTVESRNGQASLRTRRIPQRSSDHGGAIEPAAYIYAQSVSRFRRTFLLWWQRRSAHPLCWKRYKIVLLRQMTSNTGSYSWRHSYLGSRVRCAFTSCSSAGGGWRSNVCCMESCC